MDIFNKLSDEWNELNEIVPYGFGWEASRCIDRLIRYSHLFMGERKR